MKGKSMDKLETAKADLQTLVGRFNRDLRLWESDHGCGANFMFAYDEGGRKFLDVLDISAADPGAPTKDDPRVDIAMKTVAQALEEAVDGKSTDGRTA